MERETPEPYALEKLSNAVAALGGRGSARKRIHDSAEGLMVIGSHQLRPLQARFLERIISELTANPAAAAQAGDPRVMGNLQGMPPEKLEEVEADIRLLYEDVKTYF